MMIASGTDFLEIEPQASARKMLEELT
jgi:hypothetical protein